MLPQTPSITTIIESINSSKKETLTILNNLASNALISNFQKIHRSIDIPHDPYSPIASLRGFVNTPDIPNETIHGIFGSFLYSFPERFRKNFFIIAVVSIFAIPTSLATEFVVGDDKVFKYTPGVHNVLRVNGTEFQQCEAADNTVPLTTGKYVITLATPGRQWYICGVAKHFTARKMKLSIIVLSQVGSPASASAPTPSSPTSPSPSADLAFMGGLYS
ncbi:hypothetical protein PTKIN_Ptkin05aG0044200 [Pterospermum kingtungense]